MSRVIYPLNFIKERIQKNVILLFFILINVDVYAQLFNDPFGDSASAAYVYYQNRGQIIDLDMNPVDDVKYYNHKAGMYFLQNEVAFVLHEYLDSLTIEIDSFIHVPNDSLKMAENLYRMNLIFSTESVVEPISSNQSQSELNYYLGYLSDTLLNVKGFSTISYPELVPDISAHFYSNLNGPRTYFKIEPGADFNDLTFKLEGQDSLKIDSFNIEAFFNQSSISLTTGYAYELDNNGDVTLLPWVPTYRNLSNGKFKVQSGNYNGDKTLIIVLGLPEYYSQIQSDNNNLEWSTYFGQTQDDAAIAVTTDDQNKIYIISNTRSSNFPETGIQNMWQGYSGAYDIVVSIFSEFGVHQGSSFFGGTKNDYANAIIEIEEGEMCVVGSTYSSDWPTFNTTTTYHNESDIFVLRFDSVGLLFSGLYGGNRFDNPMKVTHGNGRIFIAGYTNSNSYFPIEQYQGGYNQTSFAQHNPQSLDPIFDGFLISLLQDDNSQEWGTYFGTDEFEQIWDIHFIESTNGIRVSGVTLAAFLSTDDINNPVCDVPAQNTDFPICHGGTGSFNKQVIGGFSNGFIAEFDSDYKLVWSTLIGGSTNVFSAYSPNLSGGGSTFYLSGSAFNGLGLPAPTTSWNFTSNDKRVGFIYKFENNRELSWVIQYGSNVATPYFFDLVQDDQNNVFAVGCHGSTSASDQSDYCDYPDNTEEWLPICGASSLYIQKENGIASARGDDEGFFTAFDENGSLIWSTFFGSFNDNFGGRLRERISSAHIYESSSENFMLFTGASSHVFVKTIDTRIQHGMAYNQPVPSIGFEGFFGRFNISQAYLGTNESVESVFQKNIRIFPNPTKREFNIITENNEVLKECEIYDVSGKLIKRFMNSTNLTNFNISDFNPGFYIVKVKTSKSEYQEKLIVE